ncbi:XdhC family protein [Alkalihalobacillus oceani]|uniref:XdhC family protein n=1 Tax=Halalkalibacter oceani TaxID=1653776 RepID=UPI00204013B1|nr:XdhC family protein [Halalkalibacter oceani]MCM3760065.1 XdhC family protein [Halalkalibacter oceani]
MRDVYQKLNDALHEKKRTVLATIIDVKGSAYRREGARAVIDPDGEVTGIISGGCVEPDLAAHARSVLQSNHPKKLTYDFRWSEEEVWGLGVGCNGIITVLLQPFDPIGDWQGASQLAEELGRRLTTDEPYVCTTVVASANEERYPPGSHWRTAGGQSGTAARALQETELDGVAVTLFHEAVTPQPRLMIIGAGPDAALLAKGAYELDWRVSVVDHREAYLRSYFDQYETVLIARGEFAALRPDAATYCILMTHNLELDQLALHQLLPLSFPFLGVLGSRGRIKMLLERLEAAGLRIDKKWLAKLYSPVGLEIGASSPQEITVSILSELIAFQKGKHDQPIAHMRWSYE